MWRWQPTISTARADFMQALLGYDQCRCPDANVSPEKWLCAPPTNSGQLGSAATRPYNSQLAHAGNGLMAQSGSMRAPRWTTCVSQSIALAGACEGPASDGGDEGDQLFDAADFRQLDGTQLTGYRIAPACRQRGQGADRLAGWATGGAVVPPGEVLN
jgi:hypothetical protein